MLLIVIASSLISTAHSQTVWYELTPATADRSQWAGDTAVWKWTDQSLTASTRSYDQLSSCDFFIPSNQPWTMTVELRGRRAGIFFSLDERLSKATSQMVRFEERSILVGYFNGGAEFTATSTFDSPADPSSWVTLRLDIDPRRRETTVWVDGVLAGRDTSMRFRSGVFGLQASDGVSEFRSLTVTGETALPPTSLPRIGSRPTLEHIRRIENHGASICVYHPEYRRWLTIDPDGRLMRTHEDKRNVDAQSVAYGSGRSAQIVGNAVVLSRLPQGRRDTLRDRFGSPRSLLFTSGQLLVSDPPVGGVLEYSSTGAYRRTHDALPLGGFTSPGNLVALPNGTVAVADYDRVVFITPGYDAPTLRVEHDGGTLRLSRSDGRPIRQVFPVDHELTTRQGPDGSFGVLQVEPLSVVRFRYAPAMTTIPPSAGLSRVTSFATPPTDPSLATVRRIPLMSMVYRTISYRDVYPRDRFPRVPEGRTLSDEEIESLRAAAVFNREFYFRNSSCRLSLDFDLFVVEDTLWLRDVGDRDPYWLEPRSRVASDFAKAARTFGKNPADYAGLVCTYAWMNHPPRRTSAMRDPAIEPLDTIRIRQAYGGGTYGVPAPWAYGASTGYTGNPFQDRFSRQDWLITHEFHHQLDALMDRSGYPEYSHSDLPWKMPGQFGEDFDFNARIIRRAPISSWLHLQFGWLATFTDKDQDGVPDDDPSFPIDERRLGSKSDKRDSDGDGLTDLQELMAGTSRGTIPARKDSDGDGIKDGVDPCPLYPHPVTIRRVSSATSVLPVFAKTTLGGIRVLLAMGWISGRLIVEVRTEKPANILLQLDGRGDGWFHGADNIQLRVGHRPDSVFVADYYLRDCSSWVESPRDRRGLLRSEELGLTSLRARIADAPVLNETITRFTIPAHPEFGLNWNRGNSFAFRFGIQQHDDLWVWDELFERNFMMTVSLR